MTTPIPDERLADVKARLALLTLPGMGPARTRWLLSQHDPVDVVDRIQSGELPAPIDDAPPGLKASDLMNWRSDIAKLDPDRLLEEQVDQGWTILHPDDPAWPFTDEAEPPLLLFCAGDTTLLGLSPAVAVVGTRRCTSVGRNVAHRLGLELAESGVAVVSGLALGIDAAAHKGALDGGGVPVGVVGTGLDMVYPRRNQSLWDEVIDSGLLLSEYPARTGPARWRFPARNRLIAALSDGAVIVESHGKGGALLTADEATERDRPVMAVPGSVLSPAADGTNGLIIDGAIPVRDAADVMITLGLRGERVPDHRPAQLTLVPDGPGIDLPDLVSSPRTATTTDPTAENLADVIRREVRAGSVSVDTLVLLTGAPPMKVLAVVGALSDAGEVEVEGSMIIGRH